MLVLPNMKSVLQITRLSYHYPTTQQAALRELSFQLEAGCFHVLLGPNGAGKTTLFALISGLIRLQEGSVLISGYAVDTQPLSALSRIGVIFQQPSLDLDLTVEQNLNYFAALHGIGTKSAKYRITQELDRFQLDDRRKEKVRHLNGGHRRRVEIVRALLHEPEVLLFDEPTVGLDVPSRLQITEYVHQLCKEKGVAVFWATHLIDEVYDEDDVTLLDRGKIVGQGMCKRLLKERKATDLKQVFSQLANPEYTAREVSL